jgi:hypothetical protein
VATTGADGRFTVHAIAPPAGTVVAVDVTPPAGGGLPRLLAQSASLNLGQMLEIEYAALALRDVGGTRIRRPGGPLGDVKVTLVGTLAGIGTVAAGGTTVDASGVVRIAGITGAGGDLPAMLAPARALSAVVEVAPTDHAVVGIDLTAGAPPNVDVPAAAASSTVLRQPDGTAIKDAVLDAIPVGALALAGITSAIRARARRGSRRPTRCGAR